MAKDRDAHATHIAITGASSGIGAALALTFAKPGNALSLLARRNTLLDEVASAARTRGAEVRCHTGDVRDAADVATWFGEADDWKAVDLVVANAGIFDGHGGETRLETPEEAERLVATNLLGAIYTAQAAIPRMMARRRGHIAFMSSLAAHLPAADAPTYSATKAGLLAYAEGLREYLMAYNVGVSTILPGHVQTQQTAIHDGPLPMILSASAAAGQIHRGLLARRAIIVLPRSAALLVAASRLLPWRLRARINTGSRFSVRK